MIQTQLVIKLQSITGLPFQTSKQIEVQQAAGRNGNADKIAIWADIAGQKQTSLCSGLTSVKSVNGQEVSLNNIATNFSCKTLLCFLL